MYQMTLQANESLCRGMILIAGVILSIVGVSNANANDCPANKPVVIKGTSGGINGKVWCFEDSDEAGYSQKHDELIRSKSGNFFEYRQETIATKATQDFDFSGTCVKGQTIVQPAGNDLWTYVLTVQNTCNFQVSYRLCAYSSDGSSPNSLGWLCGTATGPNAAGWLRPNESRRLMPETWSSGMKFKVAECKAPLAVGNVPRDHQATQCGKCPSPGLCGN